MLTSILLLSHLQVLSWDDRNDSVEIREIIYTYSCTGGHLILL